MRLAWTLADVSKKSDIAAIVQPIATTDSPWRFAANEILAYVDLKNGARAAAIAEYAKLADDANAPQDLRQRASGISQYLKANPPGIGSVTP